MRRKKFVLLQTAIGDYRQAVLECVKDRLGQSFLVLAGTEYFDGTTKTRVQLGDNLRLIKNFFVARRASFQVGCWRETISAEAAILELNPRIISVWALVCIRRALNRRTALWGHSSSRAGPDKGGTLLRDTMCRLAKRVVAYTETEGRRFKSRMPDLDVVVAPNALYPARLIKPAIGQDPPTNIIFVGRLVREKKPFVLLEAFAKTKDELPIDVRLVFVGAGPDAATLASRANQLGVGNRVDFTGHVGGYEALKAIYENAIAAVSPGYVGLSLTQCLSFGVPMIISRDEPHSPEIEAAQEGANCLFFSTDNSHDLADKLRMICSERREWFDRRAEIATTCSRRYSAELMADGLLKAFGL